MPRFADSMIALALAAVCVLPAGCGTTRLTDTQRTATEQLLVSNAIDQAVSQIDFYEMSGKTVFLDPQYADNAVDRGYLISSLRQLLLAAGCSLQDDRTKAEYVVEIRTGAIGTDRNSLLIGVPQMNVPSFLPGQPSQIPEIPFAKKTDQEGVAKIAVFAYNRQTGKPVWQSGVVKACSTSKDTWFLGAGPFRQGSIRKGTEFEGKPLPFAPFRDGEPENDGPVLPIAQEATWTERSPSSSNSVRVARLLSIIPIDQRPNAAEPARNPATKGAPPDNSPAPDFPTLEVMGLLSSSTSSAAYVAGPVAQPNSGGQAETLPSKVLIGGSGDGSPGSEDSDPAHVWSSGSGWFKPD